MPHGRQQNRMMETLIRSLKEQCFSTSTRRFRPTQMSSMANPITDSMVKIMQTEVGDTCRLDSLDAT